MNSTTIGFIARSACLGLALTNQILVATGRPMLPIEDEQINTLVTTGLTVGASLWAYWKNNSATKPAKLGDLVKDAVKAGSIAEADVLGLLNK